MSNERDGWIRCTDCSCPITPNIGQKLLAPICQGCLLHSLKIEWINSTGTTKSGIEHRYGKMREFNPDLEPPEVFFK